MDPPPAPIVNTSMLGKQIGYPNSTLHMLVVPRTPLSVRDTSVDVPPMSNPIEFS